MDEDRQIPAITTSLPPYARLPINHCNLPAAILGGLTFQQHPSALTLDGVVELHQQLFTDLYRTREHTRRAIRFMDYMRASFLLDNPEEAGLQQTQKRYRREKSDYLRLLRGWMFNADGREAAVLKSWVESRFGLLPRSHRGKMKGLEDSAYQQYMADRCMGLYNSNALESQLDLLYSYCQFELSRQHPGEHHIILYRGINNFSDHEILQQTQRQNATVLLNNLNSFSDSRERADEFGDTILRCRVPLAKLLYFPGLLPGILKSENEFLVIGGVYQVNILK